MKKKSFKLQSQRKIKIYLWNPLCWTGEKKKKKLNKSRFYVTLYPRVTYPWKQFWFEYTQKNKCSVIFFYTIFLSRKPISFLFTLTILIIFWEEKKTLFPFPINSNKHFLSQSPLKYLWRLKIIFFFATFWFGAFDTLSKE